MSMKRVPQLYISILKLNMVEKAKLNFRLKKIDETRNCILGEIKQKKKQNFFYKKDFDCRYNPIILLIAPMLAFSYDKNIKATST